MKLRSGLYIRTRKGKIAKIIRGKQVDIPPNGYTYCWELDDKTLISMSTSKIVKHSYNIAEILEAGDFLDFHRIEKIEGTTIFLTDGWFIDFDDVEDLVGTICTKEQFKQVSYEVSK